MTWGTTSAKSVHKFSCRFLIYMITEQEREYTLSVMHVTEFTTQQKTWCKDVWFNCSPWCSGPLILPRKGRMITLEPRRTAIWKQTDKRWGAKQKRTHDFYTPKTFNIISHGELLQQVRTHQNFGVMARKSILTKHQGKIQHVSPDGLEKGDRTDKNKSLLVGRKKKSMKGSWR